MQKKKLTISEQIVDLKMKGVTFHNTTEEEAILFLKFNNYYFKLKSYCRNYEKYRTGEKKGQYIHLDFSYLQELSTLDILFRKLILDLSLNVEHALKTQLMYDLSKNNKEDGYSIVILYLSQNYMREKLIINKLNKSATSDLIQKHLDPVHPYALWEIVEVLTFGEFIELYRLYYDTYPSKENNYSNYLGSVKFLRNAAAHNNCLLNSLKTPYNIKIHKTESLPEKFQKLMVFQKTSVING